VIIIYFFKTNVLSVGGALLQNRKFLLACMITVLHIMQDAVIAENLYNFYDDE
jgi:hypothetical protein